MPPHDSKLYVYLKVKKLGGKVIAFEKIPYECMHDTIDSIALAEIPVGSLRVIHAKQGQVEIQTTPHVRFVNAVINGSRDEAEMNAWRNYQIAQHRHLDETSLKLKEARFIRLIEDLVRDNPPIEILVSIRGQYAAVLDGFHRLSVLVTQNPNGKIRCRISPLDASSVWSTSSKRRIF